MIRHTFLALVLFFSCAAPAASEPELISVPVQKIFAPLGFDDNDLSEVIVAGEFPDTCHKVGPTRVRVDRANKSVTISQLAYKQSGICTRVFVPFMVVARVGIVDAASYAVIDGFTGKTHASLIVERGTGPGPDEFLYAPVTDSFLEPGPATSPTLVITGHWTDRCTVMKEIRVHPYADIIVVQPIAEHVATGDACVKERISFRHKVKVPVPLKGTYLLHVRSMNGQAINKLVEAP